MRNRHEESVMPSFKIGNRSVGDGHPTYFIADIAANHDGELDRALDLIALAAQAGADAVKFQHFKADKIVSDHGFRSLGGQRSHQAHWNKSVYEVYEDSSLPRKWNAELKRAAEKAGVHFFSAPYDFEAVAELEQLGVPAYKLGSGDVSWPGIIEAMAKTGKPLFAATGASNMADVTRVMAIVKSYRIPVCLMQCNTNYTGSLENFVHIHLNVLKTYAQAFPEAVLGLSDHTPGHVTVLGAVALGARAVEKHFTDDNARKGPDHAFSLDPYTWRDMVDRTRELEAALGSTVKDVAANERETVVLQRRCIRAARDLGAGHVLSAADLEMLRPAPADGFAPWALDQVVGRKLKNAKTRGDHIRRDDV
jgi:sialic acid synthase SpsE